MRFLTFVFLLFPVSAIFAQQQHITYSSGQMTPEGRSRNYFEEAYKELEAMLEGRDSLDYERAVFLTENAYWDNQIAYSDFQNLLDLHTERIRKAAGAIKEGNQHMYESLKMYEKKNFNPLASNAAIYQYLTSPRIFIRDNRVMAEALFRYSHDDPYGTEDWTNSQVLSLLNPYRREGNCYAWTALFKIFSERLKSEAHISTAPHHVYIQHKDIKGGLYNVELPTRAFPGDGTIETLTYTTREGIMSGIATRKLNLKESIGLCLIYLAKGYEYKFGESDAYFSLRCGNLALKHDSLNLNAMLLKAGVMEETLVRYMKRKRIQEPERLREIAEIKDVFIQYEQWIRRLNTLGYREIPSDVQDILLAKARGEEIATYKDRTPDAFPGLDVQDVRYITLSNGLFDEVHVKQKYMSYGRTVLDTETGRISAIVTEDSLRRYKVDPVVFALSVDPLAHKLPAWSPYTAFAANPIIYIDPTGEYPIYFLTRSYAPFKEFGPSFARFEGDNRGPTLDKGASYRTMVSIMHDTELRTTEAYGGRSTSRTVDGSKSAESRTYVNNRTKEGSDFIDVHSYGNNAAQKGSWEIDQFTKVTTGIIGDIASDHILHISGTISGDNFPNQESMIYDAKGNTLWLGNFETPEGPVKGPLYSLGRKNENDVHINIDVRIKVNADGVFQGVMQGDKTISIDDWNKQFE